MNRRRNDRSRRFFPTGAGGGEETRTNIKSGEQYRKPNSLPFENCTSPWYFWKSVSPLPQSPMKKNYKKSRYIRSLFGKLAPLMDIDHYVIVPKTGLCLQMLGPYSSYAAFV